MICADFLADANLGSDNPGVLLQSALRCFNFLPGEQRKTFLDYLAEKASLTAFDRSSLAFGLIPNRMKSSATQYFGAMAGNVRHAEPCPTLKCITETSGAIPTMIPSRT